MFFWAPIFEEARRYQQEFVDNLRNFLNTLDDDLADRWHGQLASLLWRWELRGLRITDRSRKDLYDLLVEIAPPGALERALLARLAFQKQLAKKAEMQAAAKRAANESALENRRPATVLDTSPDGGELVAFADDLADAAANGETKTTDGEGSADAGDGGPEVLGSDEGHWIAFQRHLENDGILIYQTNDFRWWRVPVKKIIFEGKEEYDLRGAVEFEPNYLQRVILNAGGVIDDDGWELILRHYTEQFADGQQQLLRDIASKELGTAFAEFAVRLLLAILATKLLKLVARFAAPAFKKIRDRLARLVKAGRKQSRAATEKELREIIEEVQDLADHGPDEATQKAARDALPDLQHEIEKTAKEIDQLSQTGGGGKPAPKDKVSNPVQQQQARPRTWATQPNAYWQYGKRFFPTRANSGLSGEALRLEQREFFVRGLRAGKDAAELRGQAAAAGYTRYGGWGRPDDRLADVGAEKALQEAIQEVSRK